MAQHHRLHLRLAIPAHEYLAYYRNQADAVMPRLGSIRMSRGPSTLKLNPRSGSSSCGDETPRSNKSPSIRLTSDRSIATAHILQNKMRGLMTGVTSVDVKALLD